MENQIKQVLKQQGRSARWLHKETGISYSAISDYCRNTRQPKKPALIAIATILGVEVEELEAKNQKATAKIAYDTHVSGSICNCEIPDIQLSDSSEEYCRKCGKYYR